MNHRTAKLASSLACVTRLLAVSFVLSAPLIAQQNPTNPPPPERDNRTELRMRDANITLLERGKDEAQRKQAALAQMNEDFERIQSVDKDILSAVSANDAPDYKRITDGLADIRKRAIRLKNYLVLPPTAKDEKAQKSRDESDLSQLRPALTTLNDLITSFVTNPLFRKESTVDYTLVARARRNLDDIIDYSEKIRRNTEKMNKSASKPD